jgi:hypothetical protein
MNTITSNLSEAEERANKLTEENGYLNTKLSEQSKTESSEPGKT